MRKTWQEKTIDAAVAEFTELMLDPALHAAR